MKQLAVALVTLVVACAAIAAPPVHTQEVLSKVYAIDRKYRSMEGPSSVQRITLGDPSKPELLWIVGMKTEMVAEDGKTPQLPELMCHVNVDLDPTKHQALFGFQRATASRLMTLSQGMLEAQLPPGFGFPIASNEPLLLLTQVLNHNIEHPNNLKVRHRVTFEYIRDADLTEPMKALFNVGASGMVQLSSNETALPSMADMPGMDHSSGASCIVAPRAPQAAASAADYVNPQGRKMTGHWAVPPGRQVNASDITWFMQLASDTRVHYAAFHLHPFAESLSVRDTTTGATLMKANAKNPADRIGLTHVHTFTSVEGVPLYRSHKYDLVSVYNNTSQANADSMASVFFALDDPEFVHTPGAEFAKRAAAMLDDNTILIHTTAGDLKLHLMRETAPATSVQVARLVYDGAFDQAHAVDKETELRVSAPANMKVRRLLQPLGEHGGTFDRGMVAFCAPSRDTNEISLAFVSAPNTAHDARCTVFARVTEGMDIVDAITHAPVALGASVKSASLSR